MDYDRIVKTLRAPSWGMSRITLDDNRKQAAYAIEQIRPAAEELAELKIQLDMFGGWESIQAAFKRIDELVTQNDSREAEIITLKAQLGGGNT